MVHEVTLPKNNFVVAPNHKMIPSIMSDIKINKSIDLSIDAVTLLGSAHVAIKSSKHSGSSALYHLHNMKEVRSLPEWKEQLSLTGWKAK